MKAFLAAEHLGQVAELNQQGQQHSRTGYRIKRSGKEVRHPVGEMENRSDFLVLHVRLPDRPGQIEFLAFGLCHLEYIPCGRGLQLQQRLVDRQRVPRDLQTAAKSFEHRLFLDLAIGEALQEVLAPAVGLIRRKRRFRQIAFCDQQTMHLGKEVEPADGADEIAGHGRIVPLCTAGADEVLEPVRIGIARDAAAQRAQGILRRVHHRRLDRTRDSPHDAEAATPPARLVGHLLYRQVLLIVLDGRLVRQHGLDEVRRLDGIIEPVPEVLLRHIVDIVVDQEVHGLLKQRPASAHAVREHLRRELDGFFHRVFLQVLANLIPGQQGKPRPLPIERRPKLVVHRRAARQVHLVFPENREMTARYRFLLRLCHRSLRIWHLLFRSSRCRLAIAEPIRDLGPAVKTEFSVIRQLRAAVHAKHYLHLFRSKVRFMIRRGSPSAAGNPSLAPLCADAICRE